MIKRILLLFLICMQVGRSFAEVPDTDQEKYIVVLMVTCNARSYIQKALDSVFDQNYSNYILLVIDDCSQDDTAEYIKEYVQSRGQEHQLALHQNRVRKEIPLINYLRAAKVSSNEDIIVVLSPQDYFAHNEVLADFNNLYQSDDVWMTYGPMRCYPSQRIIHDHAVPKEVIELRAYRDFLNTPAYLHSFYAILFKKIQINDLCYEGAFIEMDSDFAVMVPMLEMAKYHARYVPNVMMVRNTQLDHYRYSVDSERQEQVDITIRCCPKYGPLKSVIED